MADLRIALAQINTCVGDIAGNTELIRDRCRAAHALGAHVVAFPEMTTTGYPIEDLALRESFQRAAARAVDEVAAGLAAEGLGELVVILGTLGVSQSGMPFNQAVVISGGAVVARYNKHHLPNYGVFDERRIFAAGEDACVATVASSPVRLDANLVNVTGRLSGG